MKRKHISCKLCFVSDCDGCFSGCKFMSGNHCYIMRDQEGHVWLHDTRYTVCLICCYKIIGIVCVLQLVENHVSREYQKMMLSF